MRKSLFIFTLFTIAFSLSAKSNLIDSLSQRVDVLEKHSALFLHINDSLLSTNTDLSKEADYNQKLIERYDSLNGTLFNVIGALLAFFGLIVPILGYIFVVQPSNEKIKETQKLLDDIKNRMGELFSTYLNDNRDKLVDDALTQIESNNTSKKANAINCLDAYKFEGFNDNQIIRMISLIKQNKRPDFFMTLLSFTESIFTTDFLHEYIKKNPTNSLSTWVAIYAAKYDKEAFINDIAEYIIQSDNITGVFASLGSSNAYLIKVQNSDKLVNELSPERLIGYMSFIDNYKSEKYETSSEREARHTTKLYQKYLELISPEL